MKVIGILVLLALSVLGGYVLTSFDGNDSSRSAPTSRSSEETKRDLPGLPAVYTRIRRLTDCAALQAEFDTADANADLQHELGRLGTVSISYMEVALERMEQFGC